MLQMSRRVPDFPWGTLVWTPGVILAVLVFSVIYISAAQGGHGPFVRWLISSFPVLEFVVLGSGIVVLLGLAWGLGAMRGPSALPGARHYAALGFGVMHFVIVILFFFNRTVY
jgi:hypothetical protein